MAWNRDSWYNTEPRLKEIVYQMVDNQFPLSTEQFQKEIEIMPIVKGKTEMKTRYKTRYIHINVDENMSSTEVMNLGKRISMIEQKIIEKSKVFCDRTINVGVKSNNNQLAISTLSAIERDLKSLQTSLLLPEMSGRELLQNVLRKIAEYNKLTVKLTKKKPSSTNNKNSY